MNGEDARFFPDFKSTSKQGQGSSLCRKLYGIYKTNGPQIFIVPNKVIKLATETYQ